MSGIMRPAMAKIPFTQAGLDVLIKERDALLIDRPKVLEHLKRARELGDLKENGYYQSTKQRLGAVDSRLRHLTNLIKSAEVVETTQGGDTVQIGCTVTITDGKTERTYQIVGGYESDPSTGKLSHTSPIGKALVGKKMDETVAVIVPAGTITYTIVKIA